VPVPEGVIRVSLRGSLFTPVGPAEEFNHGFHLSIHDGGLPDILDERQTVAQAVADGVRDRWADHFATAQSSFASTVQWNEVRAYYIDDATGLSDGRGVAMFEPGDIRGSGTTSTPHECAICVSMYGYVDGEVSGTAAARRRGRMYLPAPSGGSVDEYGQLTDAKRATLIGWMDTFFEDVQGMNLPGGDVNHYTDVVVLSRTSGEAHQVERLGLGKVIDSQRRRRKDELEQPAFTVLSHG